MSDYDTISLLGISGTNSRYPYSMDGGDDAKRFKERLMSHAIFRNLTFYRGVSFIPHPMSWLRVVEIGG